MQKTNIANKQLAMEYVLYMMASSYFNKAKCKTEFLEKKLYIHYQETKDKEQFVLEEQCINYIEQELFEELPEDVWDQDVEISLIKSSQNEPTEIRLIGPKYMLRLRVQYKGERTKFFHQLLSRNVVNGKIK
jgi:hypothetical protein